MSIACFNEMLSAVILRDYCMNFYSKYQSKTLKPTITDEILEVNGKFVTC